MICQRNRISTKATEKQITKLLKSENKNKVRFHPTAKVIPMLNDLLYYLIVINVVTFLVYGIDKWKAKQGYWRISEATLLILAVIGGSIGALLGMKIWHHKTMHNKFKYGLPGILIIQIVLIGYLSK